MSQKEFIGNKSVSKLKSILAGKKKVLLVCGKHSYVSSGAKKIIEPYLKGKKVIFFAQFTPNPKLKDIKKGIAILRKVKPDIVLAVGGGSAIDVAKTINVLAVQKSSPELIIKKKASITKRGLPLVAIPTTSGTGSESTHFAVVYLGKKKYSLSHDYVLPNIAIVNPQFTYTLSPEIMASTGMDAFGQALESYWSVKSTITSKNFARKAIKLIYENIVTAVNKSDKKSRDAMSLAAHIAGKAINISETTACHAISYPITSYFGVPHGHAVGLTLSKMLLHISQADNQDINDVRGTKYLQEVINDINGLLKARNTQESANKIETIMRKIHLETSLNSLGIPKKGIETIVKNGFNPDRVKNNPRKLTPAALRLLLTNIY